MRPGLTPRSSSLTQLVSPNASTASLPLSERMPNGGLRRRQTGGVPPNVPDPVHVLEAIMGGPPRSASAANGHGARDVLGKPEQLEEHIDFQGLSLQDFVADKPSERLPPTSVHTYSTHSVEECTCFYSAS